MKKKKETILFAYEVNGKTTTIEVPCTKISNKKSVSIRLELPADVAKYFKTLNFDNANVVIEAESKGNDGILTLIEGKQIHKIVMDEIRSVKVIGDSCYIVREDIVVLKVHYAIDAMFELVSHDDFCMSNRNEFLALGCIDFISKGAITNAVFKDKTKHRVSKSRKVELEKRLAAKIKAIQRKSDLSSENRVKEVD